jgi:hypothetical protein
MCTVRCRSDLLKDVDDAKNRAALSAVLKDTHPSDSVRSVVDKCLETDERIKKARVVRVS